MVRQRVVLLLSVAVVALAAGAADRNELRLDQLQLSPHLLVAGNGRGDVVTYDPSSRRAQLWSGEGVLLAEQRFADLRLDGEPYDMTARGDRALLAFFDADAGGANRRRMVVVEYVTGRVKSSFFVDGVTMAMTGRDTGWVLVVRRPWSEASSPSEWGAFALRVVNDEGKVTDELELPKALQEAVESSGLSSPGAWLVRPFALGETIWLVPAAVYQLWRPQQGARPARGVDPPPCLAARGRQLAGEEAEQELLRRVRGASRETQQRMRDFLDRSRASGRPPSGFMGVAPAVAVAGQRVAVVVRGEHDRCRVDVWDMGLETPLLGVPLQPGSCPGTVVLHRTGVWIREGDHMRSLPLPLELPPPDDPCPPPPDSPRSSQAQ